MYGKAVVFLVSIASISARTTNMLLETEMPPSCFGKSYCFEKTEKYPQKLIDSIIAKLDPPVVEGEGGMSIAPRDSEDAEHGCERRVIFEPIFEILDKDSNVRYVVQSDRFTQKIRTEACVHPGRITSANWASHAAYLEKSHIQDYNISCVEKRIDYSFLALSLDGNSLEDVDVQGGVPVCCSCHISKL
ncbi:hypothetical protein ABMA28_000748 [Loxostege sticticalis]|uniref:Spaetzle domain-containing protein n=1 Tax=Loxostege sticticalis TaxID=481309 RepID=A0ABD0T641_LOXSC